MDTLDIMAKVGKVNDAIESAVKECLVLRDSNVFLPEQQGRLIAILENLVYAQVDSDRLVAEVRPKVEASLKDQVCSFDGCFPPVGVGVD